MRGEKPAENNIKRTVLDDWAWTSTTYTFDIPVAGSSVKKISIDSSQRLADVESANNSFDVEGMINK